MQFENAQTQNRAPGSVLNEVARRLVSALYTCQNSRTFWNILEDFYYSEHCTSGGISIHSNSYYALSHFFLY